MTEPRRWRPSPLYVVAAAFAILLVLVWLFFRPPQPEAPIGPPPAPSSAPGR